MGKEGCDHSRQRRSPRPEWFRRTLWWLPFAPYRCVDCGKRQWKHTGYPARELFLFAIVCLLGAVVFRSYYPDQVRLVQMQALMPAPTVTPVVDLVPHPSQVPQPSPLAGVLDDLETSVVADRRDAQALATVTVIEAKIIEYQPRTYEVFITYSGVVRRIKTERLSSPQRFVLDIDGSWAPDPLSNVGGVREVNENFVKNLRVGRYQGQVRVVLDLNDKLSYSSEVKRVANQIQLTLQELQR